MEGIVIRPARESDLAYVYDTWLNALRPEYPDMRKGDYFEWMRDKVRDLLGEPTRLLVAHPESEPDVIWGWAATLGLVCLFAYVRPEHRKRGIGRALLEPLREASWPGSMVVSFLTADARAIKARHPNLLRYIPA